MENGKAIVILLSICKILKYCNGTAVLESRLVIKYDINYNIISNKEEIFFKT